MAETNERRKRRDTFDSRDGLLLENGDVVHDLYPVLFRKATRNSGSSTEGSKALVRFSEDALCK